MTLKVGQISTVNDNEFARFFPDRPDSSLPTVTEVPAQLPVSVDKAPKGYTPMEQIALEGRAYRSLSAGSLPWPMLILGWLFIFGMQAVYAIVVIAYMRSAGTLPNDWLSGVFLLVIAGVIAIPFSILWRGTMAKCRQQSSKRQRQARYRRRMRD
ncbi:hypothetical protein [cf. Phormidesmis sp. LEGE 11477]|uniref:hypothetical protein n=1 Tax=cf. Phormidesmis sp. LEGE 11477 TaxID=1828680 RepID=UPI00187E6FE8|nr:hypothetical protein [cf. Phormidesmis sp. LEGE 11477]MBE9061128.1 hypothetical protein [cf. Phormidesmis sp. LEGE 11477]